ncbi:hypothetical protein C8R43DRAFT_179748 [Mycena crocata]|nr:hypothetical protein C8R43DRAFT_179748 [Mycena crocata]
MPTTGSKPVKPALISAIMDSIPQLQGAQEIQPVRSNVIHEGAEQMFALIESEVHAHTAAAQREIADLRTALATIKEDTWRREAALQASIASAVAGQSMVRDQLQLANQNIERLVGVLESFGIFGRKDGEILGFDEEWCRLFQLLSAAGESPDEREEGKDAAESKPTGADPVRDVGRARLLLDKRQAQCNHWKERFIEMEMDRDEQKRMKKAMGLELDLLRRQLESAQNKSHVPQLPLEA